MLAITGLFSCKQPNKSTPKIGGSEIPGSIKNTQHKQIVDDKEIYISYTYNDSKGASLIIQNSNPRGGMKYTASTGEVYMYVVLLTRIINETGDPFEMKIAFPEDSYEVPSLPGKYFKILIPPDTMTLDKEPLFNFGLAHLESFLDKNIDKPSSLKRTINANESGGFYVVILCPVEGAHGSFRTGLSLKGQDLFYRITQYTSNAAASLIKDKEIHCGTFNLKSLVLQQ